MPSRSSPPRPAFRFPSASPKRERREAERASLHEVMEKAAQFFEAALQGAEGGKARAYLRERGLSPGDPEALSHRLCACEPQCAEGASAERGHFARSR